MSKGRKEETQQYAQKRNYHKVNRQVPEVRGKKQIRLRTERSWDAFYLSTRERFLPTVTASHVTFLWGDKDQ